MHENERYCREMYLNVVLASHTNRERQQLQLQMITEVQEGEK